MTTDEQLLKSLIRTYAFLSRAPVRLNNRQSAASKTKGFGILDVLTERNGISQSELAEAAQLRQQTVSEALAALEERGFVCRVPSQTDRRVAEIYITPSGAEAQKQMRRERLYLAKTFFSALTQEEKERLFILLRKLETANRDLDLRKGEDES